MSSNLTGSVELIDELLCQHISSCIAYSMIRSAMVSLESGEVISGKCMARPVDARLGGWLP
eukprot:9243909-Alexandrium_andersonii.AAC.1